MTTTKPRASTFTQDAIELAEEVLNGGDSTTDQQLGAAQVIATFALAEKMSNLYVTSRRYSGD